MTMANRPMLRTTRVGTTTATPWCRRRFRRLLPQRLFLVVVVVVMCIRSRRMVAPPAAVQAFGVVIPPRPCPTVSPLSTRHTTTTTTTTSLAMARAFSDQHPEYSAVDRNDDDDDDDRSESAETTSAMLAKEDNDDNDNTSAVDQVDEDWFDDTNMVSDNDAGSSKQPRQRQRLQYGAMEPGTVVQIQVGDVSLARKAWKKRRRTGSPLLVPCSILHVDRASTVRWNILYLLQKFGQNTVSSSSSNNNNNNNGIALTLPQLATRHRTHLNVSLQSHATALGYETVQELVHGLFPPKVRASYGVTLSETTHTEEHTRDGDNNNNNNKIHSTVVWELHAPVSRHRARQQTANTAVLQFVDGTDPTNGEALTTTTTTAAILQHTGIVRHKRSRSEQAAVATAAQQQHAASQDGNAIESTDTATSPSTTTPARYTYQLRPLSAALRVSPQLLEQGRIHLGSTHAAVVYEYDVWGDAGQPLLTLSLNPDLRHALVKQQQQQQRAKTTTTAGGGVSTRRRRPVQYQRDELSTGTALTGTVVRLVPGGAVVDVGVVVEGNSKNGRDTTEEQRSPVYGLLRFRDAVPNANDAAAMAVVPKGQGVLSEDMEEYKDEDDDWDEILSLDDLDLDDDEKDEDDSSTPLSGASETLLSQLDLAMKDDDPDSEDITHLFQQNDDGTMSFSDLETGELQVIENTNDEFDVDNTAPPFKETDTMESLGFSRNISSEQRPYRSVTLRAGDSVNVYVKYVSKQSNQIMLTMDSAVQGKKPKDLKHQAEVQKKLSRLARQLGGFDKIRQLRGTQCDGTIKAVSATGDWCYVQPNQKGLPVGVATVMADHMAGTVLSKGDAVRIELDGFDRDRGQLAIQILDRVATP